MLSIIVFYGPDNTCYDNPRTASELRSLFLLLLSPRRSRRSHSTRCRQAGKGHRWAELPLTLEGPLWLSYALFFLMQQRIFDLKRCPGTDRSVRSDLFPTEAETTERRDGPSSRIVHILPERGRKRTT